ncbi:bifunctional diaminohydroxyphosphoribosylaminopyrimidine deaminase/5-amino-6-(5-phosphoribosylamino)uracil reductase RibD [Fulvivirgaceae bacterium BMA12]|uniref:Riboflavin biosynthesis protein RibD n=1 Tax=Agaribacillus aureus TaxID=3051825 RepID=A0ABT8LCP8_9BACT|nr:bifunctional diaminohydroxyphosphoribosylaminopyrimidine deaminase/5-amino-6-(5-phosphoribosylamino)uracil reductase RibD [Fulvivirgaceae bacterium BMA12]
MEKDELYMQRALDLAATGMGNVSPNPMVGCVIVHDDRIIGEAWHRQHGEPHAEVLALNQVKDKSLLPDSTLYVTLEPCSHYGKTPPCADRIVQDKVGRVVICNKDINPLVGGEGIKRMMDAGVQVDTRVLENKGRQLNKRFFTFFEKQRPYIILKWAQTADRFIARKNYESKWISHKFSRQMVHKWRTEEDAVMVGTNTAQYDNPRLNARDWLGKDPVRIVIDKNLRLDDGLNLFDHSQPTLCYNLLKNEIKENLKLIKLDLENYLQDLFQDLYKRKIMSVMVEGGSQLLHGLITLGLWDEARVFQSTTTFKEGIGAPVLSESLVIENAASGEDLLKIYENNGLNPKD